MPRIKNIEVARKHLPLRIVLLALAIVIAIAAFGYGISVWLTTKPGWTVIKVNSININCSEDFALNYNLGAGEVDATAENKQLTALYTKATEDAYQLFYNEYVSDELHNIRYVNEHINHEITVEPALYKALSAIVAAGNRSIYLAPAYAQYRQLFVCGSDAEAIQYDPQRQSETKAYIAQIARFANDPEMIDIQILGNQRIKVQVAQDYLDFIQANEIEYVLDFSWMVNAFIVDYIAEVLIENGYINGFLASYDGFTRNLCSSDQSFSLNVFQRMGKNVLIPATMDYSGGCSIVSLRDFPINEKDRWRYYAFEDGRIARLFIDTADGEEKSVVTNMTSYSKNAGCVEILLSIAPLYLAGTLDTEKVSWLTQNGIYTVYADGKTVYSNNANLTLNLSFGYTKATIE